MMHCTALHLDSTSLRRRTPGSAARMSMSMTGMMMPRTRGGPTWTEVAYG